MMTAIEHAKMDKQGGSFALAGLLIGLLTGLALYAIAEFWIDNERAPRLSVTTFLFVGTLSASTLLLANAGRYAGALLGSIVIAALLAIPNYFMTITADPELDIRLQEFPSFFWFFLGGPVAWYLMVTLAKAMLDEKRTPPPYPAVFFHGLTLPLIAVGAKIFAVLSLVLLFAWAALLKSMNVLFFNELFQEPWFIMPFLGAIAGLSIAMMRAQQSVLGALRFILLLFSRIAMPIMALFSLTLLIVFAANGVQPIFDRPYPSAWILALSFAGMLVFNGVYQNGEGAPPPAWLRLSTIIALISFPIYAGIAAYAFWLRIDAYGLTPPRVIGLAMTGLALLYSVVCIAGVVTELNWRGKKWMPLVAPLNTLMAFIWVAVLVSLATPIANPWAISAKSQTTLLLQQKISAEDFNFGYLRFRLGAYGEKALTKLETASDHPEAALIREGVLRARNASNIWEYENGIDGASIEAIPDGERATTREPIAPETDGPMGLELNPDDNPNKDNDAAP